jgi:PAS domain S-box-containing protein
MSHDIFSAFTSEELQTAVHSKLFRGMLDTMPVGVAVLAATRGTRNNSIAEFTYIFANKAAQKLANDELAGRNFYFNDDSVLFNKMAAVADSGKPYSFEHRFDGKWLQYHINRFDGGVLLSYDDITKQKKTELSLERERRHVIQSQSLANVGSFEWDIENDTFYWSDEMFRIHGFEYQAATLPSQTVFGFVHPDDAARIRKKFELYSHKTGSEEINFKLRLKDNSVRYIVGRLESFRGEDGKMSHVSGLIRDITDRKNREDELRQSIDTLERQSKGKEKNDAKLGDYERIVNGSHDAIVNIDRKGNVTNWNPMAEKLYGYTADQAIGRQIKNLIIPESKYEEYESLLHKLNAGETILEFETVKVRRDKSEIDVIANILPLKDAQGKINGAAITTKDITESKKSLLQLRKTEEILNLINDACYQLDNDGKVTYINRKALELFHMKPEDIIGRNIWEVFPESIKTKCLDTIQHSALDNKKFSQYEYVSAVLGTWISLSATPTDDGCIVMFHEIDDLHNVRKELKESKDLLQSIFDISPVIIYVVDAVRDENNKIIDFQFKIANQELSKNTNHPALVGKLFTEEFPGILPTGHFDMLVEVLETGVTNQAVLKYYEDGLNNWYLQAASKFGQNSVVITGLDITRQKEVEQALEENTRFIQSMVLATPDILYVMEIESRNLVFTTQDIGLRLGYTKKDVANMKEPFFEVMFPDDLQKMLDHIEDMKDAVDDEVREIEYRMVHADGSLHWFIDRNTVFKRDEKGIPSEKLGITRDIMSGKESEEKIHVLNKSLKDKNRALRSLNNEMKTFTSIAAYDFKDTLQILYTNLEYIIIRDAQNLSNTGKANLRKAQTAIQKMKLLTDDIINFSRLQTLDDDSTLVDLNVIIEKVKSEMADKITESKAQIESDKLPVITGYPFLLALLFHQLLDNAIKFRKQDESLHIKITYHVLEKSDGNLHQVSVSDNGIGFSQEESEKVFEMFYKLHDKTAYKGSGTGLAVSRKIVELHNGTIVTESEPGKGTKVCCFFPFQ